MNSREAIERGMDALEKRGRFTVTRAKAKASKEPQDRPTVADREAADDADAWNVLRHLSRII